MWGFREIQSNSASNATLSEHVHGPNKHFQFEPTFCEQCKTYVYIGVFACGCPVVLALFIEKTILSSVNHFYSFVRYNQWI